MHAFSSKEIRILQVIFLVLLITGHIYVKRETEPKARESQTAKKGETIASFSGKTLDNKPIDLAVQAKEHKLIVINFWETWCGPCRTELPYLQEVYANNKSKGLEIIAVFHDSSLDSVHEMIQKNSLTYTMVYDENKSIFKQFKVEGLPTTIVTDQNLKVLRSHEGIDAGLRNFIESELGKGGK